MIERVEVEGKGRHYVHPESRRKMPSVTNVNGVLPKYWLAPWVAKEERDLVIKAACNVYAALNGERLARRQFRDRLKFALPQKKAHEIIRDEAAELGTEAHRLIEWRILMELGRDAGPEPEIPEESLWAVAAWEDWRRRVNLRASHAEKRLYSDDLDAAGTTDAICCELDVFMLSVTPRRITAIADWKRSKAIRREAEIQVAALRHMAIERGLLDESAWGLIVRLPQTVKEPEVEERYIRPSRCRELVEVFRAARRIWHWANEDKETPR